MFALSEALAHPQPRPPYTPQNKLRAAGLVWGPHPQVANFVLEEGAATKLQPSALSMLVPMRPAKGKGPPAGPTKAAAPQVK